MQALQVRLATSDDWPRIWPIIQDVGTEQETFPYDPAMTEPEARGRFQTQSHGAQADPAQYRVA
ncbi:GNAT family N-acetyltransferase [Amycolatopsis jiangsuensis]|uniref:GNAT family N-acetyltransferase n=1 Tax=Amycolatopsis jiangsuensis TaxID=1181879 RepID=A0A840IU55_9PSEU|nr:hypothetical protein [Amycolatopsis jiangsuensis]MBB4686191.1 hypothetical protein [Amycolatopsis jiangsuensis]